MLGSAWGQKPDNGATSTDPGFETKETRPGLYRKMIGILSK